jgi:RNA polymerase sigma factor (sigma-70 family)
MKLLNSLPEDKLTEVAEEALACKIQNDKTDEGSINKLVLHNMREAFLYSKKVCRERLPDDELFSLCYATLVRNAKRFTPKGVRFFAFTKVAIRGAIARHWRSLDTVRNASMHETGEPATPRCLPELDDAYDAPRFDLSTDPSIDADFKGIEIRERMIAVSAIMEDKLTDQEQMIISLVYTSGFNFQEVGDLLGITRSAAQLSHAKSIKKIRAELGRTKQLL